MRHRVVFGSFFSLSVLALVLLAPLTIGSEVDLESIESKVKASAAKVYEATVCLTIQGGRGAGSGVVVSEDGLVLTAAHVIPKVGEEIRLIFPSGRSVKGKSLGVLRDRDAGMARITEPGPWTYANVAKSPPRPGDWVFALGHSGGFQIERGAPLRLGRVLRASSFLQTDCFVTGGDSGGPLFDLDGRVVGIHSSIGGSTDQNMHVPISVYNENWERLEKGEEVGKKKMSPPARMLQPTPGGTGRPYLGVTFGEGLTVKSVEPGQAAAFAGLEEGDLLTELKGVPLSNLGDLARVLTQCRPRERIRITVRRKGRTRRLSTTLGARGQDDGFLRHQRDHISVLRKFPETVRGLEKSVVRLRCKDKLVAYGTTVSGKGLVVTKASEVADREIRCELSDGSELAARVVHTFDKHDLALVQVASDGLTVPKWREETLAIGTLTCSSLGGLPTELILGVVSVLPRGLEGGHRPVLGVLLKEVEGGVRIEELVPGTPAATAGLATGDVILSIQGKKVRVRMDVVREVTAAGLGKRVTVRYRRGDKESEVAVELKKHAVGARRNRSSPQDAMGASRSRRRSGFQRVLQHDGDLRPEECGSPLVDLSGRVVGINVARAGRTKSYAVPSSAVLEVVSAWIDRQEKEDKEAGELAEFERALTRAKAAAYDAYRVQANAQREVEELEVQLEKAKAAVEKHQPRIREAEKAVEEAERKLRERRARRKSERREI